MYYEDGDDDDDDDDDRNVDHFKTIDQTLKHCHYVTSECSNDWGNFWSSKHTDS